MSMVSTGDVLLIYGCPPKFHCPVVVRLLVLLEHLMGMCTQ